MSHGIYITVLVVIIGATTAKPYSGLDLSIVINQMLCPTVVEYDEDLDRIPRVIKTVQCKENPDEVCAAQNRPEQCCQSHRSDGTVYKCVQVTDTVLVSRKDSSRNYTIPVAIGCSCVGQPVTYALTVN